MSTQNKYRDISKKTVVLTLHIKNRKYKKCDIAHRSVVNFNYVSLPKFVPN